LQGSRETPAACSRTVPRGGPFLQCQCCRNGSSGDPPSARCAIQPALAVGRACAGATTNAPSDSHAPRNPLFTTLAHGCFVRHSATAPGAALPSPHPQGLGDRLRLRGCAAWRAVQPGRGCLGIELRHHAERPASSRCPALQGALPRRDAHPIRKGRLMVLGLAGTGPPLGGSKIGREGV
jgi:hypothetical protein